MQQWTEQGEAPSLTEPVSSRGVRGPEQPVRNIESAADPPRWAGHGSSSGIAI